MIESKIPLSRYMFYLCGLIKNDSLDKDFLYEIIRDYPNIVINLQQILPKKFNKEIPTLIKLYNYDFDKIYSSLFNNE